MFYLLHCLPTLSCNGRQWVGRPSPRFCCWTCFNHTVKNCITSSVLHYLYLHILRPTSLCNIPVDPWGMLNKYIDKHSRAPLEKSVFGKVMRERALLLARENYRGVICRSKSRFLLFASVSFPAINSTTRRLDVSCVGAPWSTTLSGESARSLGEILRWWDGSTEWTK